ncbi:putative abc transporter c family member, partial [Operophtera brumata]
MEYLGIKWEDICGPNGLQPWDDDAKDFSQCFEELFMQIPIGFLIAIISGYYVGYRKDWVIREKAQERAIIIRCFVVLVLAFIPVIELYVYLSNVNFILHPLDYFAAGTSCLSWLVHFGYVLALKHRLGSSSRGPLVQLIMWSLAVMLNIIMLRSNIKMGSSVRFTVASLCCHGIYFLTLLPSSESSPTYYSPCLVGSQHTHSEYTPLIPHLDEGVLGTAMQGIGCISTLTFAWVNPLLQKARMDRSLIGNVDEYQQYADVPHEPFIASGYGATGETAPQSTPVTPSARVLLPPVRRQNVTLLRALHSCFAFQFYSIGILKLVSDMAGFAGPLLLNKLVSYVYAAGLLTATLVSALFNVHFNWLMSIIGLKMRGAIVATILRKTLSVTSTELTKTFTVGEITNFMSTDTDRIVNSCPSFHALWSIPLQLFITLFLLYQQVGVSFLAGVAFSVILIPINKVIANKIGDLSTELMRHKDSRVSLISDLLRGIRTVKIHWTLNVLIPCWFQLPDMQAEHYYDKVNTNKDEDKIIIFKNATFSWVKPMKRKPQAKLKKNKGKSNKRLSKGNVQRPDETTSSSEAVNININGSSVANTDEPFMLRDICLEIGKDELIGFGYVSQKPWLVRGTIRDNIIFGKHYDEAKFRTVVDACALTEDLNILGWNAYVGEGGCTLSGGQRARIALARAVYQDKQVYLLDDVLSGVDATVAQHIMQRCILGVLRHTTRVLVSHSPRHLARTHSTLLLRDGCVVRHGTCHYTNRLYLLDDVLSGVDATVAQHIMQRCILGVLRHTTLVLVSHSPRHLGRTHSTLLLRDGCVVRHCTCHYTNRLYLLDDVLSGGFDIAQHLALRASCPPESVLNDIEEFLPSEAESIGEELPRPVQPKHSDQHDNVSRNSLDEEEAMSQGTVGWWVIGMYLRSVGITLSITIVISLILMQLSQNYTFLWLTYWVKAKSQNITHNIDIFEDTALTENDPILAEKSSMLDHGVVAIDGLVHKLINSTMSIIHKLDGHSSTGLNETAIPLQETLASNISVDYQDNFYLEVYFGLAGLNLVFTIMRAFLFAYGGVKAATGIHKVLLKVVIK